MRVLLVHSSLVLSGGCGSSVPVTFYGQSVDEYVSKPGNNYDLFPAAIQQRRQLVSIDDGPTPFGLILSDHNLFLYFTTKRVGQDKYQYGGKAAQSFWGEYSFDEEGFIEILMVKGNEERLSGSAEKLERLFERTVINAKTYDITGNTLRLYSPEDVLEFVVPPARISF
jgi:hypothetical protein